MSWYYNTESGALTSSGAVQGFLQDLQAAAGLGAGWHKLNIAATATEAQAAAEAKKEFPTGTAPTTSVATQVANTAGGGAAVGAFTSTENALSGFYDVVTNGKMWRSLGWLLLGVILLFVGVVLLLRKQIEGVAGDVLRSGVLLQMAAPVVPLAVLGTGLYLAWFGVHYWGSDTKWPSDPVKAVLTGKPLPQPTGQTSAAATAAGVEAAHPTAAGTAAGQAITNVATGSAISNDALKYEGEGYVWGGPADVPGNWDCSSFVSYVLGHDLGMGLPGGGKYGAAGYPPHAHGPTTNDYLLFGSPVNLGSEKPGDLVVSTVHMGIVIGGGGMISAQDPQLGTGIGTYTSGFPGGTPFVRRVG